MTKISFRIPNGSRVQRARRHLAEARQAAFNRLADGRRMAQTALRTHAEKAPKVCSPVRHRLRDWALHKLAEVVAWKIERDTYKIKFQNLVYEKGLDGWLTAMHGRTAQGQ